jgi:large subunit ribosomal protein L23
MLIKSDLITKTVISEKSLATAEKGVYVFEVAIEATKADIKEAIQTIFSVEVSRVAVLITRGREKRRMRYNKSKTATYVLPSKIKKAYVTLKPGFSIAMPIDNSVDSSVSEQGAL